LVSYLKFDYHVADTSHCIDRHPSAEIAQPRAQPVDENLERIRYGVAAGAVNVIFKKHLRNQGERLCDVVVGASVQPGNPIVNLDPRRQNDHRQCHSCFSQFAQQVETILIGQPEIEHNRIIRALVDLIARILCIVYSVGSKASFSQSLGDQLGQALDVFDD
jgi:hypothetical protein